MFATFNPKSRTQDPVSVSYKKAISASEIATLKSNIEATYKVAFIYSGNEYDYDIKLVGNTRETTRALGTLFPNVRSDIVVQRSQY
jgi:hypothetical protein